MSCIVKRIITITYPTKKQEVGVYDKNNQIISSDCEFSWSLDKVCWTPWVNHTTYKKIISNSNDEMYVRVRICIEEIGGITLNGIVCNNYEIHFDNTENVFAQDVCTDASKLDPYSGLDCALLLQQQLSDTVICMLGIQIYYFKTNPKKETKNYTFKEYTLFGTDKVKQLKMMIPDGEMPSSKPQLEEMDFTFDTEWECELSKKQFAEVFGDTAFPNYRDYVYVPMQKRLYTVNSAYDEKKDGLLWQTPTWKIALVKYTEQSNVDFSDDIEQLISSVTTNAYKEVFEQGERREQLMSNANTLESPRYAATNVVSTILNDSIRSLISKTIDIKDFQINNKSLISSKSYYQFNQPEDLISYQEKLCGTDGSISLLASFPLINESLDKTLLSIGNEKVKLIFDNINKEYKITYSGIEVNVPVNTTQMIVLSWSRDLNIHTINMYTHTLPDDLSQANTNIPQTMWYFKPIDNPIVRNYNSDYIFTTPQPIILMGYPLTIHSLKVYDAYLGDKINDIFRYVSNNKNCIICDSVRSLVDGHGYSVK